MAHAAHGLEIGVKTTAAERGQPGGAHDVRHAGPAGFTQINHRISTMGGKRLKLALLAAGDSARGGCQDGEIIGNNPHRAAIDLAVSGDFTVGRRFFFHSHHIGMIQHADLKEGIRVQETINSFPGGKLTLIMLFFYFIGAAHF